MGDLLNDVQRSKVYTDGKTFVDLIPAKRIEAIIEEYELVKSDPTFNLQDFIARHFYSESTAEHAEAYVSNPHHTPLQHVDELWSVLERRNRRPRGSLEMLPYTYIVPGGRFNEQFYWDSYFIMLGLASGGNWRRIEQMVKNFTFQLRKYGYIPTTNRSYLSSRSQPPFFSHMVRLLASQRGKRVLREYLPSLLTEYRFWMKGRLKLAESDHRAFRRLVEMKDGSMLNRYYDNKVAPRPESFREDVEAAELSGRARSDRMYLHLRAAAESGWDFSSRWFLDPNDIHTIHTADIIPVDLNALLYHLEDTIADAYRASFNIVRARQFRKKAQARRDAVDRYLWSEKSGFYRDYNFHQRKKTPVESLAGVFPLYVRMASGEQAQKVAEKLEQDFLKPGGLVATNVNNGQQWDAPNGWAPLQWVAIEGLRNYGYDDLADRITERWVSLNESVYTDSQKFVEKYNVLGGDGLGGGGEYVLQDGFGWTNGVYEALKKSFRP